MRKPALAVILLLLAGLPALAENEKPQLPRVPRGFDEGREQIVKEARDNLITPGLMLERMFEQADLEDIGAFTFRHLTKDEKAALDEALGLGGKLVTRADAKATVKLLRDNEIKPAQGVGALAEIVKSQELSLADTVTWLYARDFNFRILQRGMDGQRLDPFKIRRELRAKDAPALELVYPGLWEFNIDDGREEKGGYYDGVQLVECMFALDWTIDDFARALGKRDPGELSVAQRRLIEWGDPNLLWPAIELGLPESELIKRIRAHYEANNDPRVLEVALLRAETFLRWFRTGGPGVKGVYTGPWPNAKGEPAPPTTRVNDIHGDDAELIAGELNEEITGHFDAAVTTLTVIVYEDGSARAVIDKPGRTPVNFGPASPLGNVNTTRQMYEGRVSLRGRNGLFYAIYDREETVAPQEFELANVKLHASDTFFVADVDDGMQLTPILLKRTSRLVEFD